ncbi:MAG TPA: hypothetical protein VF210_03630, partial [Pseudomonadales bacterium]
MIAINSRRETDGIASPRLSPPALPRQSASMTLPTIIQGGMGVGVSGWRLARAVALQGQLGVVAGTALATTLVRRLQLGDPGDHLRRALEAFPAPAIAERIYEKYFRAAVGAASG